MPIRLPKTRAMVWRVKRWASYLTEHRKLEPLICALAAHVHIFWGLRRPHSLGCIVSETSGALNGFFQFAFETFMFLPSAIASYRLLRFFVLQRDISQVQQMGLFICGEAGDGLGALSRIANNAEFRLAAHKMTPDEMARY